jgi:hypothetical protein
MVALRSAAMSVPPPPMEWPLTARRFRSIRLAATLLFTR